MSFGLWLREEVEVQRKGCSIEGFELSLEAEGVLCWFISQAFDYVANGLIPYNDGRAKDEVDIDRAAVFGVAFGQEIGGPSSNQDNLVFVESQR